jgi:hypothetical protein
MEQAMKSNAPVTFGFQFWPTVSKLEPVRVILAALVLVLGAIPARAQEAELAPIIVTGTFEFQRRPSAIDLFTLHLLKQIETKRAFEESVARSPWYYSRFWSYAPMRLESSSSDSSQFFTPRYLTSEYQNAEEALRKTEKQSLFDRK